MFNIDDCLKKLSESLKRTVLKSRLICIMLQLWLIVQPITVIWIRRKVPAEPLGTATVEVLRLRNHRTRLLREENAMPVFHNASEQFYYEYEQKKGQASLFPEIDIIIESDDGKIDFFDLCKKYEEIALNAPKFKDGDAVMQDVDINNAIEETKNFYHQYDITDKDALLAAIHMMYPYAREWGDGRASGSTVEWNDTTARRNGGVVGTYYNFRKIPGNVWSSIKADAIKALENIEL